MIGCTGAFDCYYEAGLGYESTLLLFLFEDLNPGTVPFVWYVKK